MHTMVRTVNNQCGKTIREVTEQLATYHNPEALQIKPRFSKPVPTFLGAFRAFDYKVCALD